MKSRLQGRNPELTQSAYDEITLGENVCEKIKDIYYPNEDWSKVLNEVAKKYYKLKILIQVSMKQQNEIEVLKLINYMDDNDIRDYLDNN